MQYALGPRAVIREKHEALGVLVETTDWIETVARADELDDR
jgi:hypothetical protein